jgi:hypothetical protein
MTKRIATSFLAALLGAAMTVGWIDAAASAPVVRSGVLRFTGIVTLTADVPANALISGMVQLSGGGGSRLISASATLKRSGKTATMTISVPYSWKLDGTSTPNNTLTVTFTAHTTSPIGLSAGAAVTMAWPANGKTTAVTIPAAL